MARISIIEIAEYHYRQYPSSCTVKSHIITRDRLRKLERLNGKTLECAAPSRKETRKWIKWMGKSIGVQDREQAVFKIEAFPRKLSFHWEGLSAMYQDNANSFDSGSLLICRNCLEHIN